MVTRRKMVSRLEEDQNPGPYRLKLFRGPSYVPPLGWIHDLDVTGGDPGNNHVLQQAFIDETMGYGWKRSRSGLLKRPLHSLCDEAELLGRLDQAECRGTAQRGARLNPQLGHGLFLAIMLGDSTQARGPAVRIIALLDRIHNSVTQVVRPARALTRCNYFLLFLLYLTDKIIGSIPLRPSFDNAFV